MSNSSNRPLLRFAPSPNGLLHLGHAFSALYTWNAAAALRGTTLLRIEDTDIERCKPEFIEALTADLHWLGLDWPQPVLQQSQRFPVYARAGERLRDLDLLFPCFCSRAEIAAAATGTDPEGAPLYPGTCRHLTATQQIERIERGDPVQFRLRSERAIAMVGPLTFTIAGPLVTARRKSGTPAPNVGVMWCYSARAPPPAIISAL